jgi:glutaconate CoA-transferase subunit B
MAKEIADGDVVATGAASFLAILAIAVARATHAPNLTYLSCIGSINPTLDRLHFSSEDLAYFEGRCGEFTIPDLFDHAKRGRVDVMFFGAAEVDGFGFTNLTATGTLTQPQVKFPGVAGAGTLRRWVRNPILVVGRQSRRNLVGRVQIASTSDPDRRTRLITDLGTFDLGPSGARLLARHPRTTLESIQERTGFPFQVVFPLPMTQSPEPEYVRAIQRIDSHRIRDRLVG